MEFNTKLRIILWKRYFDTGYGISSIIKYIIGLVGIGGMIKGMTLYTMFLIGLAYAVFCFFLGWAFIRFEWYRAEIEISNRYNLFVEEVRKKIGVKNNRKI